MDTIGSLVDTNLRIFPSKILLDYIKTISIDENVPLNIVKLLKGKSYDGKHKDLKEYEKIPVHLDGKDVENLNKIKAFMKEHNEVVEEKNKQDIVEEPSPDKDSENEESEIIKPGKVESSDEGDHNGKSKDKQNLNEDNTIDELHLTTADIDWLYTHLQQQRKNEGSGDKNIPYLHVLLEGARIETPKNPTIKRNPILEARCVKLRAQQDARDYRKMTKSVDNVRMRFPEDSISYQLKQMNRQLIAIGQFIISIFAGFLFGFRGVEWMVGNLDFGFRLLLGVMCALIIALAEIYFLAKKLNEELNIPETVQLGGPPKFVDQPNHPYEHVPKVSDKAVDKEHQD